MKFEYVSLFNLSKTKCLFAPLDRDLVEHNWWSVNNNPLFVISVNRCVNT